MTASIAASMDAQHRGFDAGLVATAHLLDDGQLAAADTAVAELAEDLRQHIELEEDHLFPAFERLPEAALALTREMRAQHRALEGLVAEMAAAIARRELGAALHAKAALHAALGVHDDDEAAICAALDRGLDADAHAALIALLGP